MLNIETLREYCLSKPDVEEDMPFGNSTLVFKVNNKIFLLAPLDKTLQFNVKCDPDKAVELRAQFSSVEPGFHMNKKHWNTVTVDETIPYELLLSFIDHSYNLVKLAKKKSNS